MTKNLRHIHYINPSIQKHLMISLMVAELILISLTVFWLYIDMDKLIANNMFRIHIQNTQSAEFIINRLTKVAFILLLVNSLVASAIVWYWKNYIRQIIAPLEDVSDSILQLNFTTTPRISIPHETGEIATQWLQREKNQFVKIRQYIAKMNTEDPASLSKALDECRCLIEQQN